MDLAELCDLAYVELRDDVVRRVEADRAAAITVLAVGGQCEIPDVDAELSAFETALDADPSTSAASRRDFERAAIRYAIGLSAREVS